MFSTVNSRCENKFVSMETLLTKSINTYENFSNSDYLKMAFKACSKNVFLGGRNNLKYTLTSVLIVFFRLLAPNNQSHNDVWDNEDKK